MKYSDIIKLLHQQPYYNESEAIEVAKGRNYLPLTLHATIKQLKRLSRWQKR